MTNYFKLMAVAIVAWAAVAAGTTALGDIVSPVTDWVRHNGPGTPVITDPLTNSPTFNVSTANDDTTVMGRFSNTILANDGDFIKLTTTLTMTGRTNNTGAVGLNTMLRIGLFNGPDAAVAFEDVPNLGIVMVYANTNQAANRQLRAQTDAMQINPVTNATNLAQGTDTGNQVQGANPGPIDFELTLTLNAGLLDIAGEISGTDSVGGAPYLATYSLSGYDPSAIGLAFDRVGFYFGSQVNAPSALLANVLVTSGTAAVPESRFGMLAVALLIGAAMTGLKVRRVLWQRRGHLQP